MIDEYKSASCCLFLVLFWRLKSGEIIALSEGLNDRIPDLDLDEGLSEFPGPIDEYESASCCLFLVLFLATENGEIRVLSEGLNDHLPDRDLDEGQSKVPDQKNEYKSVRSCLFLVLFWRPKIVRNGVKSISQEIDFWVRFFSAL